MNDLFIRAASIDWEEVPASSYVRGITAVARLEKLELERHVTVFSGDNGTGKSTLLEAIAAEGTVPEITAGAFLSRHGLVAPSSVRAALPGLIEHDLVYRSQSGYIVYDYLLAEYLRRIGDATCRPRC